MKVPYSMILDFVKTSLTAEQAGDLLTMAGLELEGIDVVDDEPVLDINITANRGDAASVFGLSREILAKDPESTPTDLYASATRRFPVQESSCENNANIKIESEACSRYACRLFKNVENGPSPDWLQKRLNQAGMRPINLLVDLSNYVMLEIGQPLHAFDHDKISGTGITIREAKNGEKLVTLDEQEHELQTHHLLICDEKEGLAVAGVMGGRDSEVSETTKNVLLESAHFHPSSVRKTKKNLGFFTESSYRFERWVDPEGTIGALNRFRELYIQITGRELDCISGVKEAYPQPYQAAPIEVRMGRTQKILGMAINPSDAQQYLTKLGFTVLGEGEPFTVHPPSWRPDVVREIDLIEEIGRVHGYDRIPEDPAKATITLGGIKGIYKKIDQTIDYMIRRGYHQIISHTLRDSHPLDNPHLEPVLVKNPHSPDTSHLRCSLLPCLSDAAKRNEGKDLLLFELGRIFHKSGNQFSESRQLGIWSQGDFGTAHWSQQNKQDSNFYFLKGVIEGLAESLNMKVELSIPKKSDPRFHGTRQATIELGKKTIGMVGELNPMVADKLSISSKTYLAEIDIDLMLDSSEDHLKLKEISKNPAVRRDIAIVVDKSVPYSKIKSSIEKSAGDLLEKTWLFDLYSGKGIPENSHSMAIGMILRKLGKNLTDDDANKVRDQIVSDLSKLGAALR